MKINKIKLILFLVSMSILFLFGARLTYGMMNDKPQARFNNLSYCGGNQQYKLKNYASKKIQRSYSQIKPAPQAPSFVDQKYEKVATLASGTTRFKNDEKKLRTEIKAYNALIQFEQRTGLADSRCLHLAIGIHPDKFDQFIKTLRGIGSVQRIQINKTDKTNEFKAIKAKKESLLKIQASLLRLKNRNGQIAEFVKLENRILEIEKEIQQLGVSLGEYDAENEFCTVKFTLAEGSLLSGGGIGSILLESIGWTLMYGVLAGLLLLLMSMAFYVIILAFLKLMPFAKELLNKAR